MFVFFIRQIGTNSTAFVPPSGSSSMASSS
jgi:hypothetical protein